MSLAVLKRKALNHNSRIAPISGNGVFSLNGIHRQHTYIGQSNIGLHNSNCGCSSSNTINKSVQTHKAILSVRYSDTGCGKGNICSTPVYKDISGNKNQGEYTDELLYKCYREPKYVGSSNSNCYTKNKNKLERCSTVKTGPEFNLGPLSYSDRIKKLKRNNKKCL